LDRRILLAEDEVLLCLLGCGCFAPFPSGLIDGLLDAKLEPEPFDDLLLLVFPLTTDTPPMGPTRRLVCDSAWR
jgi:hypothetical protein